MLKKNNLFKTLTEKIKSLSLIQYLSAFTPVILITILVIMNLNKNMNILMTMIFFSLLMFILIIIYFFIDKDNFINEQKNAEEDNGYYKAYLNVMIDSLNLANTQMENVKILVNYKNVDLTPYFKKIEGVYIHLDRVVPPEKYEEYHEDVLFELKSFLTKYNK